MRDAKVVDILEKMGYAVATAPPLSERSSGEHQVELVRERIAKLHTWDEKLLDHTYMRINSMGERQLMTRVGRIKDREKMLYFAKVLMDKNRYPSVLREIIRVIIEKGW